MDNDERRIGRRFVMRKGPTFMARGFVSIENRLQRREISTVDGFMRSDSREPFWNITLQAEYHHPGGSSAIDDIVFADEIMFVVDRLGICTAYNRETREVICELNTSQEEVIRTIFYNNINESLITGWVVVLPDERISSTKYRSTRIEDIKMGLNAGSPMFDSESPHLVEFDETNQKIHVYHNGVYKLVDLNDYATIFSIPDANIKEIITGPGMVSFMYKRINHKVSLKIVSLEDGTVLKSVGLSLQGSKKLEFAQHLDEKIIFKQADGDLQILDVVTDEVSQISASEFGSPGALVILDGKQQFLTFTGKSISVWSSQGKCLTASLNDHRLFHEDTSNTTYVTSDQERVISYCEDTSQPQRSGSINMSCLRTGKSLGKITATGTRVVTEVCNCSLSCGGRQCNAARVEALGIKSSVREALQDVTVVSYDDVRNEIYTGNRKGRVHMWSN